MLSIREKGEKLVRKLPFQKQIFMENLKRTFKACFIRVNGK